MPISRSELFRMILVYIFLLTFLFVYLWHRIFRWILQKSSEREIGIYRTLIIGANRPAEELIRRLILTKSHIKPVAIIDASGTGKTIIAGVPVVGKMDMFERAIAQHQIDHILQTDHLEQTLNIINYALQNNLKYIMPPELLGIFQGHQTLEEIEGRPFLKVYREKSWWEKIW
jgi:FlaA1/EpsC-like NDP-sugar epimerase